MAYRIILRRDTAANWTSNNPVLLAGEPGYETDTGKMKIGDGESTWTNLAYFVITPTGVTGPTGPGATGPGVDLLNVQSHIIPATGGVYDLGATAGYEWRDLYLSGNSIYLGGAKLSSDGTNFNMNSVIVGGPTGDGGVLLSAQGGTIFSNGVPIGSPGIIDILYADLLFGSTSGTLIPGSFYRITDFRTCYDQPDFDYNNNAITTGTYKQSDIDPVIVFATSESTISTDAYQPAYPNDMIKYDLSWSTTEVTGGTAYGRISERIDEYNNRTDYDHRTILFKRYRLYTHREDQPLNGTIEIFQDASIIGTGTKFTLLAEGDVIYVPNASPNYYEIVSIIDDFNMGITGDIIGTNGRGLRFYKAIEESNGNNGYFSYKRTNVKTNDFVEYTTFGNALLNSYAKNNYVGNYSNFPEGDFILANNVFLEGGYNSNKFGDNCYNNTFGTDNSNNIWGDYCYENVSTNDIDDNIIGHYFNRNLINLNLASNHIGNNFRDNRLLSENGNSFSSNIIADNFNSNTIYSSFYDNRILNNAESNFIGDYGNLTNFNFYQNSIGENFNNNVIRQNFRENSIDNQFQSNVINGEFYKNVISNNFDSNNIGHDFNSNRIGNDFNSNTIVDYFQKNTISGYFETNRVSFYFEKNQINLNFTGNSFGDVQYFNWDNTTIENLEARTYGTFYSSLDNGGIGNLILGKELIMHDTVNNEYHKIKFTQWTQNGNGGGFSYERTKVYPSVEPTVYFTRTNYGSEVDVIVEGSLEITRNSNNGAIYNQAAEGGWNSNQSPAGTEWNSIYTQTDNGSYFTDNTIGNLFNSNSIGNDFRYNKIGNGFEDNNIQRGFGYTGNVFKGNVIGDNFYINSIGEYFLDNNISAEFYNNQTYSYFQMNDIKSVVFDTDFTENYGNVVNFTYTTNASTATNGLYTGVTGSTDNTGINASFTIGVSGDAVYLVSLDTSGKYYNINDTITILGSQIGGTDVDDDVVIEITGISTKPTVYEEFNCDIFKNSANTNRLSYYDGLDILTIKNIND